MKYLITISILVLTVSGCLCSDPPARQRREQAQTPKKEPKPTMEKMLADINAGRPVSPDDITIVRFRRLLESLSEKYPEGKQQIADMSVTATKILREENGIDITLLSIMEGMNKILTSKDENQEYKVHMASYLTMRENGQTHEDTIKALKALALASKDLGQ